MKAVFLDRDGVIINNANHYYIYRKKDVQFVDGIFENLQQLKNKGFSFFIVSNQGGIAKKQYSHQDVATVHQFLRQEFNKYGITFLDIYYCPHHDSVEPCLCRKPSSLMIEKLIAKYEIDPENSYLIGDSQTDIQAAQSAGIHSIQINANKNMKPFIHKLLQ